MATTHVGSSDQTFTTISTQTTLTRTRSAGAIGNAIIIGAGSSVVGAAITISDTDGNTWNVCNPDFNDGTNLNRQQSWYCNAKSTSSTTITITRAAGTGFTCMFLDELNNAAGNVTLDQVNHSAAGATGTNITGTAITLGANDCVVWSMMIDGVTAVGNIDGSAATKGADDTQNDWTEYRILTGRTGVSVAAAWTSSGTYEYFIASFKPPASGDTQEWRGTYPPARRTGTINVTY